MNVAILGQATSDSRTRLCLPMPGITLRCGRPRDTASVHCLNASRLHSPGAANGLDGDVASDVAAAIVGASTVIIAVPAYGHAAVMNACAPHLTASQTVFVMPMLSLSALYLARLLHARRVEVPIVGFGTTVMTARKSGPSEVKLLSIRSKIDLAALPVRQTEEALRVATLLYGDRFNAQSDTLAIAMVNVNPVSHVPLALANLTRIEQREVWTQYDNMTGAVAKMIVAVDHERLAVAAAFGLSVRSIEEHFHYSFGVPMADSEPDDGGTHRRRQSARAGVARVTLFHRGRTLRLGVYAAMGRVVGVKTPCNDACVALASAACGRRFAEENEIVSALRLDRLGAKELLALARDGYH